MKEVKSTGIRIANNNNKTIAFVFQLYTRVKAGYISFAQPMIQSIVQKVERSAKQFSLKLALFVSAICRFFYNILKSLFPLWFVKGENFIMLFFI